MASYARVDDKSQLNQDGSLVGIGYTYKLFDATWLYVNWGKQFNNSNASFSMLNGGDLVGRVVEPGYNPDGVMIGLNTKF
jgi:predicted porin